MYYCNKCGDPVAPNEKFCNKCGNKIDISPNPTNQITSPPNKNQNVIVNNVNQYNTTKNSDTIKMMLLGGGIGLIITIVLILIYNSFNNEYFFNIKINKNDNESQTVANSQQKKGKYQTVIIHDNIYTGVDINNKKDAMNLIVKDSVSQKKNCPTEIKKIEDNLIKQYNITAVNLCEMNVDFAKELDKVFNKIYTEYPQAKDYLTNLSLVNAPLSESYIAAFLPIFNFATSNSDTAYPWVIKTQVFLNTAYFLNPERLKESVIDGSNSNHFPKNATIYSPVAHELGHYLSFLALMKHYQMKSILLIKDNNLDKFTKIQSDFAQGNYSLKMINEAFEKYKKETNNTTISLDEWRGTISNYALAKDNNGNYIYDETIAESFHDVYLNGNNASAASKYVTSVLKEKLGSR